MVGGSADLATSDRTRLKFDGAGDFQRGSYGGRNLHFGVREHGMAAALSGLSLCKIRPFGGTFFNFSDYMRPSIRLASIMEIPTIYIFTHDSIGLGEDGPTHEPIEQLAALRAMPGLMLLRPADANEVVEAWKVIMQLRDHPVALVLTRQAVPTFDRSKYGPASGVARGAYILADATEGKPDVILMGTGSEVSLCVEAYEQLKSQGIKARVVSMPSWDLFERQDEAYQRQVLPVEVKARVSVEAAATFGWSRYLGPTGIAIGMHRFGASAPIKDLLKKFGFTTEKVVAAAREAIARAKS
jgi:transketolase